MADPFPRGRGGFHDPADQAEAAAGQSPRLQRLTTKCCRNHKDPPLLLLLLPTGAVGSALLSHHHHGGAGLSLDLEEFQPVSDYFWKFFFFLLLSVSHKPA